METDKSEVEVAEATPAEQLYDTSPQAVEERVTRIRLGMLDDRSLDTKEKLMLMRDLTKTSNDQKRHKTEEKSNENQAAMVAAMAEHVANLKMNSQRQEIPVNAPPPPSVDPSAFAGIEEVGDEELVMEMGSPTYEELYESGASKE